MSPTEIAILGLGFGIGAGVGATLVAVLRGRSLARREVRITVAPNSIAPRRASTLSYAEAATDDGSGPTTFGDEAWPLPEPAPVAAAVPVAGPVVPAVAPAAAISTPVLSAPVALPAAAVAVPVGDGPPVGRPAVAFPVGVPISLAVPVAIEPAARGVAESVPRAVAQAAQRAPAPAATMTPVVTSPARLTAVASPVRVAALADREPLAPVAPAMPAVRPTLDSASCRAEQILVDERCATAGAARERARLAAERLRDVRNAYELLREQAERAMEAADPGQLAAAKDALHRSFREARDAATTSADMEAAARDWLDGVNQANAAARGARAIVEATDREIRDVQPRLERLVAEAESARAAAETAEAGCREAREILAACEEERAEALAFFPVPAAVAAHGGVAAAPGASGTADAGIEMAIVRILRGDGAAREQLAARLATGDGAGLAAWRARVDALVGAIVARAIDDGFLDLPDAGFWRPFTRSERRDVVSALAALGFHFDGVAGFADGRVPTQRDLALAVGYAGLDRMRIRTWPGDAELATLFGHAIVVGEEWLADRATDLSLGRMVDALGARADDLADAWNAWGRIRPALIATD